MVPSDYDDDRRIGPGTAYAEPSRHSRGPWRIVVGTFAVVGLVALGWVGYVAYDEGVRTAAVKTVPVIQADAGEIKRKPDNPGGLAVPHRDKLVFNRLAPGQSDEPVERLLPPPEVPVALPSLDSSEPPVKPADAASANAPSASAPSAGADTEIATALTPLLVEPLPHPQKKPEVDAAVAPPPPPPAPPPEPTKLGPNAPDSKPSDSKLAAPKLVPPPGTPTVLPAKSPPPPAPAVKKLPAVTPDAAWGIQLASLKSQKDTATFWAQLKKANKDLLGGLELRVQTVKLAKGTFYRVQAVPLANRAAAASLCGTLKSRKQDCLVVAPKR